MQNIAAKPSTHESKSEIKKYTVESLISKFHRQLRSEFNEIVKNPICGDSHLTADGKMSLTQEFIDWNRFKQDLPDKDFKFEDVNQYSPKIEIIGIRNDDSLELFIHNLIYSFTQMSASISHEYNISSIIAKTFDVHFSDDLFAEHIFDAKTPSHSDQIAINKLLQDYNWAIEQFSDETKEIVLFKIKKMIVENAANKLTPQYYNYSNEIYTKEKSSTQEIVDSEDLGIIDEYLKQEINYQCAENLISNSERLRFSHFPAKECNNLSEIFSHYQISQKKQYDLVNEYIAGELTRITESKDSPNKKGNDFASDIGQELVAKYKEIVTEEDKKLFTDKVKANSIKESILTEYRDNLYGDELNNFVQVLNIDTKLTQFDKGLLKEISITSPSLVSLFEKFKITDMSSLETTKKVLGSDIFNFAVTIPNYRVDLELTDVLKYKKYGLRGYQINNICYGTRGTKFESESEEVKYILTLLTGGADRNWQDFEYENISTDSSLRSIENVTVLDTDYIDHLDMEINRIKTEMDKVDLNTLSKKDIFELEDEYTKYEVKYFQNSGEERKHQISISSREKSDLMYEHELTVEAYEQENKLDIGFRNMFEVFGYKEMMTYSTNKDITPHDALFCFNEILHLFGQSGLNPQQFYNNIFADIKADTSTYEAGSAHHMLNSISQVLKYENTNDMEQTIINIKNIFPESNINSVHDIFASWVNLKKFYTLFQSKSEMYALAEIKKNGSEKQLKYAQELIFHKGSKVNTNEVIRFITNPDSFFKSSDVHSDYNLHNNKKPSNYYDIPHLPLTAEDLRDAIIEGSLDRIQVFRPLEVEYSLPKTDVKPPTFEEELSRALGSRKDDIKPEAKEIKGLTRNIKSTLEKNGYIFEQYSDFTTALAKIISKAKILSNELKIELEKAIYNKQNGINKYEPEKTIFIAKINLKSDPNGVLAGDDTACCMPFGSGKNNIYTANPNCGMFTIQVKQADSTLRTIAQSVLTKDYQTQETIPDLMSFISSGQLDKISDMTEKSNVVLSCDNIELNPNWNDRDCQEKIRKIYQDFFKEYLDRFSELDNLDSDKIIIGQGYTDLTMNVPKVLNQYLPLAPVAYSDKMHNTVLSLAVGISDIAKNQKKSQINEYDKKIDCEITTPGISYATFENTLSISYIETTKAYTDNQDSITGLHNMENGLIAKDIYNAHHYRPNMSIKYADKDGKVRGYMFAYEGKENKESNLNFLYISDLATDKTSKLHGGRLIQGFIELYEKNYLSKGDRIPIKFQSRESTSYRIIQNQLSQLGEKLGVKFDLVENGHILRNGEKFIETLIIPSKIEA
ncbi:MAG: hypothetical protein H7196_04170 [candidate division SR1 bacterium]|nr:hypothetical protein [candidate division SR1 bacterium]